MLTDFYEITMANGYFANGFRDTTVYFDMFFRELPDGGGFAIMAGVQQLVEYFENLTFTAADIDYLRGCGIFSEPFLQYLADFRFCCDVWAVPEGMPIFPGEPIITVRGPAMQAQFVETMILLTVNHESLIATKANRVCRAAQGRPVMEFGSRRAQGPDGAVLGARAAYIGGCCGTACTICGKEYGIPALGTMAHSWIQLFDTELDAFRAYARTYPKGCTLLIDTYNVLKSGLPNAIRVFREEIVPRGFRPGGIRIDSGDITYLSRKARKILDDAGFPDCKICASNSLDEYIIRDMLSQGACVDSFGVGERMITSSSHPIFGGVYKLSGVENAEGGVTPKIKISENVTKITTPGFKKIYRLYDRETNKAIADVITLHDETIDDEKPYVIFDPDFVWKKKTVTNFRAVEIRERIMNGGKNVMRRRTMQELQDYCKKQVDTLWDEVKRFENPHRYYVDLSQKLWDVKNTLISRYSG